MGPGRSHSDQGPMAPRLFDLYVKSRRPRYPLNPIDHAPAALRGVPAPWNPDHFMETKRAFAPLWKPTTNPMRIGCAPWYSLMEAKKDKPKQHPPQNLLGCGELAINSLSPFNKDPTFATKQIWNNHQPNRQNYPPTNHLVLGGHATPLARFTANPALNVRPADEHRDGVSRKPFYLRLPLKCDC